MIDSSKLPQAMTYPVGGPRIPLASADLIDLPESYDCEKLRVNASAWPQFDQGDERPHVLEEFLHEYTPVNREHEWIKTVIGIISALIILAILARMLGWI